MKKNIILLSLCFIVLGGGFLFYWLSLPKNAREQMEYAKRLEEQWVQSKADLTPEGIETLKNKIVDAYHKVEIFPEKELYDDALMCLGDFYLQIEDFTKALETYLKFEERFATSELLPEVRKAIIAIHTAQKEWQKLIDYYEEYIKKNPQSIQTLEYVFEIAKIKKSNLPNLVPMAKIKAFERVIELEANEIKDPGQRKWTPICLWEIALLYESIDQHSEAVQYFQRLIQEYPDSEYTTKALMKKGELLAEKLGKKEEAKKTLEDLKRNHPESNEGRKAGGKIRKIDQEIKEEKGEESKSKQEKYLKEHYGGGSDYDISHEMLKNLGAKGLTNETVGQVIKQKLDLLHYEGEIKIQPDQNRMDAKLALTIQNNGEPKNNFMLLLSPMVSLDKISMGTENIRFDRADVRLKIILNKSWAPGTSITLEFQLYLINKTVGNICLQETGYALSDATWYPGAFLGDIFTTKLTYLIPKDWEIVGNGVLLIEDIQTIENKEWRRKTYEMTLPIFGAYFGYGKYKVVKDQWKGIPISFFYKNEQFTKTTEMLNTLKDILDFYEARFSPFPFAQMTIIESPLPMGIGGVGPATLMFLHEDLLKNNQIPESIMAHEAAHQWWGNQVPISFEKDGTTYSQWLSEGFSSYSDALYLEHKHGKTRFLNHLLKYGSLYFEQCTHIEDIAINKNLFHPSYVGVIYMKGACVLHALRWVMGDEKFSLALKKFAKDYAYQFSTIQSFKKICDEIHGEDLYWFFKQWTDSAGYPHYYVKSVDSTPNAGQFDHKVVILQETDVYRMPVFIQFEGETPGQQWGQIFWLQELRHELTVPLPFKAKKVILDPDSWIMKFPGDHHLWTEELFARRSKMAKGEEGLAPKDVLPDFSETDLDGNLINPQNYRGKVVLVNFWATWCPPCVQEIPQFIELQKKYGLQGFQIISICMDENLKEEDIRSFCREAKINYPVIPYVTVSFEKFGAIKAIPLTYLVTKEGTIDQQIQGTKSIEFWEEAIQTLLK